MTVSTEFNDRFCLTKSVEGASSLLVIILLSQPLFRRPSYELFLRIHQGQEQPPLGQHDPILARTDRFNVNDDLSLANFCTVLQHDVELVHLP